MSKGTLRQSIGSTNDLSRSVQKLPTPRKIDFSNKTKKRLIRSVWEKKKKETGSSGKNFVVLNKQVSHRSLPSCSPLPLQSTTDPGTLLQNLVHKKYGSLLFKNLPFLEERSGFSRFELIQMFSHFVVLSKITSFVKTRSDDIFRVNGIDFSTF